MNSVDLTVGWSFRIFCQTLMRRKQVYWLASVVKMLFKEIIATLICQVSHSDFLPFAESVRHIFRDLIPKIRALSRFDSWMELMNLLSDLNEMEAGLLVHKCHEDAFQRGNWTSLICQVCHLTVACLLCDMMLRDSSYGWALHREICQGFLE